MAHGGGWVAVADEPLRLSPVYAVDGDRCFLSDLAPSPIGGAARPAPARPPPPTPTSPAPAPPPGLPRDRRAGPAPKNRAHGSRLPRCRRLAGIRHAPLF